ncbi:hypothetical protein DHEL01_v200098 [Diaporthe helianthi]|uniref:Uncharacterized protein n=1 Tax=Diaporthe helianthi TaxID=158607 RepID=A0A2P5IG82_DIAHE|nr:hypothetical protein DHEL01_v200098 [Diaporthe helianthi]
MDGASRTPVQHTSDVSAATVRLVSESNSYSAGPGAAYHQAPSMPQAPGLRDQSGRTFETEDVKEILLLLAQADIPTCIAGVYALRYFGAGRVSNAPPAPFLFECLRHIRPTFRLKGVNLVFILVPGSDYFINPSPECCELSIHGIPYPKIHHFARSLLVLQNGSDLEDFIDGMDLDMAWAEANVDFDDLQLKGLEFTKERNAEFKERDCGSFSMNIDYRTCELKVQYPSLDFSPSRGDLLPEDPPPPLEDPTPPPLPPPPP